MRNLNYRAIEKPAEAKLELWKSYISGGDTSFLHDIPGRQIFGHGPFAVLTTDGTRWWLFESAEEQDEFAKEHDDVYRT